jgi:DNA-binding MarR family transcriptional regulator
MASPEEIALLMKEFGKNYTRKLFAEVGRAGTTPARARLLMVLQCRGSCKMSEIGTELGVTPRNITKLVDGLEAESLVVREQHPEDRRATLIRLTANGMLVCKESAMANHAVIASIFQKLSAADRKHMARILQRLIDILQAEAQDSPSA